MLVILRCLTQQRCIVTAARENIGDPDRLIFNDVENNVLPLEWDNPDARPEIISLYTAEGGISNFLAALEDPVSEPGGRHHVEAGLKDVVEQLLDILNRIGAILDRKALHFAQLLCFA